jgi:fumarate hydratase subunit alpha
MRNIGAAKITAAVEKLCVPANTELNKDVKRALEKALRKEKNGIAKEILKQLVENYRIAEKERIPLCQDTGMAVIFAQIGQEARITGGNFSEAVNEGIRLGYKKGYLRKSIVSDPLRREIGRAHV